MCQTFTFGDAKLQAICCQEEKQLTLELIEPASGRRWGPAPLLALEIFARAEGRVDTERQYRIDEVVPLNDGLHIIVGDGFRGIRIGLSLCVRNGELVVRMPMTEVYEDRLATFRLFSVILLPGLMTTTGTLLLPLRTGYLCRTAGKPRVRDRFLIYGEQPRWELLPLMPLAAVQGEYGGLMVLATEAAGETECHVHTDGTGSGGVAFGFSVRQFWPDPVEFAAREVRYMPLLATDDLVHTPARRLHRHIVEDLGKPTLTQRLAESPELRYLRDAYTMKTFFGIENQGIAMHGQAKGNPITFHRVMTFAECGDILAKIRAAGIDRVVTQAVGWNARGHDGLWPSRFPVEERLGGEEGFRLLNACGTALGFQMNVHDNYTGGFAASPDFDIEEAMVNQWGEPISGGEWGGGLSYILNMDNVPDEKIAREMQRVKALGLEGMGYLDGMGNPLYRDYHPRHRLTRTGYARRTQRLLEIGKRVYGAVGTECGFLYAVLPSDCIVTLFEPRHEGWCRPEWPVGELLDRNVPVLQLALHGLLFIENHGENWGGAMEGVLWGGHPRTEWSAHAGIMPVADEAFIARLKGVYDVVLGRFGHLQEQQILSYSEPADGVKQTAFEDGTVVTADFDKQELLVNGQLVPRPEALRL